MGPSTLLTRRGVIRLGAIIGAAGTLAAGTLWTAPAAAAPPQVSPETQAAAYIRPAVVYVTSALPDGTTSHCTGFVVNPDGYIATAGHCVDPEHVMKSEMSSTSETSNAILDQIEQTGMTVSVIGAGLKTTPARVVDVHPEGQGDVALLKVSAANLPSSQLSTAASQVGAGIQAVGYPGPTDSSDTSWHPDPSLEPTLKSGTVSALTTAGAAPVIEVSAAMVPGMSGGPTIDDAGKVVGINSFTTQLNSNFNYSSAVSELQEMMKNNGVTSALSPADTAYRQALGAYFQGDYGAAVQGFDQALNLSPTYPTAAVKRTDAANKQAVAAATPSGGASMPGWVLAGAGALVGLAVIGGVGYYFYTHRGKGAAAGMPVDAVPAGSVRPPAPAQAGATPTVPYGAPPSGPPAGAPRRCNNCGFELPPGQAFCGRCGKAQE
ncbi:trypsin-like peptidase domain-containing protein [Gordonia sp. NPDC003424]